MIMESLGLKKQNIIKDIRNIFRLEKETKAIKSRILSDMTSQFEHEDKNYYKPVTVNKFWSNNYIEYESSSGTF